MIGNRHARTYRCHLEGVSGAHRVRRCEALDYIRQRAARGPTAPRLSRDDQLHGQSAECHCETLSLNAVRHWWRRDQHAVLPR
jgi:hypothetical protein